MTEETMNPKQQIETPLYVVDDDGYYWYECLICDALLYSEWTTAMARIEATGELVSFCCNHTDLEIHRMTKVVESPEVDILADKPRGN